jgi:hypothetical protein
VCDKIHDRVANIVCHPVVVHRGWFF